MGETIPPESKSQRASEREEDPHESVTIAPPAPNFDEILRLPTPVPSLSARSDQHFHAALDAGQRAGGSLAELSKLVAELYGGVSGAKRANEQLVQELATLRAMLGSANEQNLSLKHRVAELEQEVVGAVQEGEAQRRFLTEQHDEFLAALLEEHEEALARATEGDTRRMSADVSDLAQKLVQSEAARVQIEQECQRAREALARTQAQRDEAQARAQGRERERDELRAEASMLRARLGTMRTLSTTPPPPVASRPPSFRPPALELDAGELDSNLHSRPSSPRLPLSPRHTPPPAELERAVYTPRPVSVSPRLPSFSPRPAPGSEPPAGDSERPVSASAFPRVDARPGVGGAKGEPRPPSFGPPPSGWTPPPPPPEPEPTPTDQPSLSPRPRTLSAASIPPSQVPKLPALKQKPDPTSRPLISYSLGKDGVESELLEGARVSTKPPRK